jgi:PBP1b-binding outer membrane lipoprotein LpoB
MKSKLAATVVALALVLTGCGSSGTPSDPSSSATVPAETTLTQWVNDSGLITTITGVTDGLNADLANLTSTDVTAANSAFAERATALQPLIDAVSGLPQSDDVEFEKLRATMASTLQDFADAAGKLGASTKANRTGLVLATTTSMTSLTSAIQALVDYIAAHGTDSVHPA